MKADLAKIRALVELAADERTPVHERTNAAVLACKRLKESGLLDEEGAEISSEETVTARVALLVMSESSAHYRLAILAPKKGSSDRIVTIPKRFVRAVRFMTAEDAKEIGWKGCRVVEQITLLRSYFDEAARNGWTVFPH